MNQESITAENIYCKITRLRDELADLKEAKDLLYEGQVGGMAHSLVKAAYDEKNRELNIFKRTKFVEVLPEIELSTGEQEEGGLRFP